jgi:hypothetical protein
VPASVARQATVCAELLESKFFKQRASAAELSERLLKMLPSLEQRFKLLHGGTAEGEAPR